MGDISIAEWITYGLIAYSGMIILITSVIKDVPITKPLALVRSIYLFPSAIASFILANSGVNVTWLTTITNNTIRSVNTTQTWTESVTQTDKIVLASPVWSMFHYLLGIVMIIVIIQHVLFLLTRVRKNTDEEGG